MRAPDARRYRIRAALSVALAAATAAIAVWMLGADPMPMPPLDKVGASESPPTASTAQPAREAPDSASSKASPLAMSDRTPSPSPQPLPDADTPVVDVIDAMEDRARRGDVRAACWLGETLRQCHQHGARVLQAFDSDEQIAERIARQRVSPAEEERQLRFAMLQRDERRRLQRVCAALTRERSRRAPYFQLQAAQAGHLPSMLRFVQLDPYSSAEDMVADPALAQLYHQHGVPVFVRALESGDPVAILQWQAQLMPGAVSLLAGRLPPELTQHRVATAVSQRMLQPIEDRLRHEGHLDPSTRPPSLPPRLTAEEQALADQLYQRFIGDGRGLQRALDRIQPGVEPFAPTADDPTDCQSAWPD